MRKRRPPKPEIAGEPKGRLRRAGLAIMWERIWPACWPAVGVAGLFVAVALFEIPAMLPGWLHLVVLGIFATALLYGLKELPAALRPPSQAERTRRLEAAGDTVHRPLTAMRDKLAAGSGDAMSEALWRAHRSRMRSMLPRLRAGWPSPGLPRRDPLGLRAAVGLLLVIALVYAEGEPWPRIARAVSPDLSAGPPPAPAVLDVWINPPAYTGVAPIFVQSVVQESVPLDVPVNSAVLAQIHGGMGVPRLTIGRDSQEFEPLGPESYRVEAEIAGGDHLRVEQDGAVIAAWPLSVVGDGAPTIEYLSPPARSRRAALRLEYEARDDYGIAGVVAKVTRPDATAEAVAAEPIELTLPLPGLDVREARGKGFFDLTAHPWAGVEVDVTLEATDAVGQVGESEPFTMVLPERVFQHPVARAIVEQRKRLTTNPEQRRDVSTSLRAIASNPPMYSDDVVVFLALKIAVKRLRKIDGEPPAMAAVIGDVQALLWDTALRIEEGRLGIAERELREAQQALMDALANEAPMSEIEQRIDELERAIDRFMQSLAESARNQEPGDESAAAEAQPFLDLETRDLQQLLDRVRELMRAGAREAAQSLLSELQDMLENLQAATPEMLRARGEFGRMMEELQSIMRRQQQLLDETYEQSQRDGKGGPGQEGGPQEARPGGLAGGASEQEAVRRALGELMRQLGESTGDIPIPFGRAEQSMRRSSDALRQNMPGDAVDPQAEALGQLQQGASTLMQRMMERLGMDARQGTGEAQLESGRRDPLGRQLPGFGGIDTDDVDIPDEAEIKKARTILEELRRRASDWDRPRLELDYLDRLLRRF